MDSSLTTFLDDHIVVHTHIEKCGGSTLLHYLTTLFGKKHSLDVRSFLNKGRMRTLWEVQKRKHELALLSGHIHYNSPWIKLIADKQWAGRVIPSLLNPYGKKQLLYVASIRHPIDRLNSLFRYIKISPKHPDYYEDINNSSFDDFIQTLILKNHFKSKNALCMQITGCQNSQQLLEKAKQAFDHHYLAIVPHNKTHELANMFAEVLQQPNVEPKIINSNTSIEISIPNKKTISLLEERCHDDIQLYEYICKGYQEKLIKAKKQLNGFPNKY